MWIISGRSFHRSQPQCKKLLLESSPVPCPPIPLGLPPLVLCNTRHAPASDADRQSRILRHGRRGRFQHHNRPTLKNLRNHYIKPPSPYPFSDRETNSFRPITFIYLPTSRPVSHYPHNARLLSFIGGSRHGCRCGAFSSQAESEGCFRWLPLQCYGIVQRGG